MTTETLMTETAATTNEGSAASEPTATQDATGAGAGGQQQQPESSQTAEVAAQEGSKAADEKAKPEGAPEKYELAAPEGKEFSQEVLGAFSEAARELNLSNESAQKMLDKIGPAFAERQANAMEAARTQWVNDSRGDKEFGGDKLQENIATAKKALDKFGTPELVTLLNESGLGNHPEIIRAFYRAGMAISEDGFVSGSGGQTIGKGDARKLYAASNMNP